MNSDKSSAGFFTRHGTTMLFCLGAVFVLAFSFAALTTKPKISTDEAVSIELARNFQTEGVLDVKTAPGVFSGLGERLQSTGYPVTVPLSWFFGLFGFGLPQARIFMVLWMLAAAGFLFWLARRWWGDGAGIAAFFLLITFAPFYANGRTAVGEIPGFLFLLAGLYFLFSGERFLWAGFFMGFAVTSKPSVFGLVIPALALAYLIELRKFFRVIAPVALGILPAGLVWIFFNLKEPFLESTWANLFRFYQNPYGSSIGSNVFHNLVTAPRSATLVYFGVLFAVILSARFVAGNGRKNLYDFVVVYSLLAFGYYLRSPGWLRYVLIAEFLVLFLLPDALFRLFAFFGKKIPAFPCGGRPWPIFVLAALVATQCVQMFTVSKIFSSDAAARAAQSINEDFPGKSVGVLNAIEVGVWLNAPERYLAMDLTGLPQIGLNPLLRKAPPDVLVGYPSQRFFAEGENVLNSRYAISGTVGGYTIYVLKHN